ncbi:MULTISPECIES: PilZ domain-containing protein [Sphingomonas]|uniref:PilZ domain-containing protein n=1 Tax=Sphingomonas TaxID=13687 RepID=UPI000DEF382C|nr:MULTISPECIES: PilZ domain-containing protein [Sphingomonas]
MEQDNKRRDGRERLTAAVNFRKPKEMPYEVSLENMSPHGCCIALRERVVEGQLLWITVPGIEPLQSWVRWHGEWHAGLEFERPMHVAVFDHVAGQMKRVTAAAN